MIKKSVSAIAVLSTLTSPHYAQAQSTYASMPPVSSSTALQSADQLRIQGITKTLMAYPAQTEAILQNYVGIDTAKIDLNQFFDIIARGNAAEIQNEVTTLYTNRAAFNNGTFTDVSYYNYNAPAPALADGTITPVEDVSPEIADAAPPVAAETAPKATNSIVSAIVDTHAGTVATGLAITAGIAAGAALSGGSGNANDRVNTGGGTTPPVTDVFNRAALTDTATPASFVDAEFNNYPLGALAKENVQYAYAKGLTGAGVTIGFHDFFSDDSLSDAELNSRITYQNLNVAADTVFLSSYCSSDPTSEAACNHGGHVMDYAAADRNGTGPMGVAFGANLMMNSVFAGVGSVRTLADQGADIVNFSCSGCATLADLQYIAGLGVLMTSATGNDDNGGPGSVDPNPGSPAANASVLDYQMIAVTGVYNYGGALISYGYDGCGSQMEYCMSAYSLEGTSFAAPQIAGGAALVKEGWNYLTAKQISQILLYSAKDIGAAGVDAIFGHGLLDMKAAMAPVGSVTAMSGHGILSNFSPSIIQQNQTSAFGNAFTASGNANGNVVVVDSFGRDFNVKTQDHLAMAQEDKFSADRLFALGRKKNNLKTVDLSDKLSLKFSRQQTQLDSNDIVSFAEYDVTPAAKLKMGFSTDMSNLETNDMQKFNKAAFLSQDVFNNGYLNFSDNDQVFNQAIELIPSKNTKVKVSSYYSKNSDADYFKPVDNQVTSDFASSVVDTSFKPSDAVNINFRNGVTHEYDSVLGAKFSGSFEMENGADTYFTGVDVSYDVTPNWNVLGSYTVGSTKAKPSARSSFTEISNLTSDSFAVTATRDEVLGHDSLSFSVGQPTRVRSGTATGLTQSVDRTTGDVSVASFQQSLVPTGRNLQFQAAYQKELSDDIDINFALEYETNPYQQADVEAATSGFLKLIYELN